MPLWNRNNFNPLPQENRANLKTVINSDKNIFMLWSAFNTNIDTYGILFLNYLYVPYQTATTAQDVDLSSYRIEASDISDNVSIGQYHSMAVDGSAVFMAFSDDDNGNLWYGYTEDGTRSDLSADMWNFYSITGISAEDISIVYSKPSYIHISFYDNLSQKLKYVHASNIADTNSVITIEGSTNSQYSQIAADASSVFIGWHNVSDNNIHLSSNITGSWVHKEINNDGSGGEHLSMVLNVIGDYYPYNEYKLYFCYTHNNNLYYTQTYEYKDPSATTLEKLTSGVPYKMIKENMDSTTNSVSMSISKRYPSDENPVRIYILHDSALSLSYFYIQENNLSVQISSVLSRTKIVTWGDDKPYNIPSDPSDIRVIAVAREHILALKTDGTVDAWGSGKGITQSESERSDLSGVIAIATGDVHNMVLKSDGTIDTWPVADEPGPLNNITVPEAAVDVVAIASSGLSNDSEGWKWRCAAVTLDGSSVEQWGYIPDGSAVPIGLTDVSSIALSQHGSVAITKDGSYNYWGEDSLLNSLPNGVGSVSAIAIDSSTNTHVVLTTPSREIWSWNDNGDVMGPSGNDIIAISANNGVIFGLKSEGTIIAWPPSHTIPSEVSGNVISMGISPTTSFAAALLKDTTSDCSIVTHNNYVFLGFLTSDRVCLYWKKIPIVRTLPVEL